MGEGMIPHRSSAKAELRRQIRIALKAMSSADRTVASAEIRARLEQQHAWHKAKSILFFAPLTDEPDVWPLLVEALSTGKIAALPRFAGEHQKYVACRINNVGRDLREGRFRIREPRADCAEIPLNQLDFMLVPGVAFDLDGHRLGRGEGHYDRLLASFEGLACGVAFDQQVVGHVPVEPHDAQLSCILTPTRWHWVAGQRAVLK
jgi:5-formyltetrahydrofolate cyclo-ligase